LFSLRGLALCFLGLGVLLDFSRLGAALVLLALFRGGELGRRSLGLQLGLRGAALIILALFRSR